MAKPEKKPRERKKPFNIYEMSEHDLQSVIAHKLINMKTNDDRIFFINYLLASYCVKLRGCGRRLNIEIQCGEGGDILAEICKCGASK